MCPPFVGKMVCHVLAVETPADGVVLVDTGLGSADVATPRARLGREFVAITRPRLDAAETAMAQLGRLGFSARDVRHVVVTHLDLDHAGGLSDFPDAAVHVSDAEHEAAMTRPSAGERQRYRPAQWAHRPKWQLHRAGPHDGEAGTASTACARSTGCRRRSCACRSHGHTRGHHGIAIRRAGDAGWMLHAGDAYFHRDEMRARPRCPLSLRAFQRLVAVDDAARLANQRRLRALAADAGAAVRIFCAHDPSELERVPVATLTPRHASCFSLITRRRTRCSGRWP